MSHPVGLSGPPLLSALIIKHSSDQVIRRVVYGWNPQRVRPTFPLHSQPRAVTTKRERGEDKAKDTSNDSSLTARLMTQHTKVWSGAAF